MDRNKLIPLMLLATLPLCGALPLTLWSNLNSPDYNIAQFAFPLGSLPVAPVTNWTFTGGATYGGAYSGAYDASGNVYFLMTGTGGTGTGAILKITTSGTQSFVLTSSNLTQCLAIDSSGNFYGYDSVSHGISMYTSAGSGPTTVDGRALTGHSLAFNANGQLIAFFVFGGTQQLVSYSIPSYTATVLNASVGLASVVLTSEKPCFDTSGNIYIGYAGGTGTGRIAQISPAGTVLNTAFHTFTALSGATYAPGYLAYDPVASQFFVGLVNNLGLGTGVLVVLDSSGNLLPLSAYALGTTAGPYDITSSNNKLRVSVDGATAVTATLTTGASVSASTIVSDINAAYGSSIASAVGGAVQISSSTTGSGSTIDFPSVANSAGTVLTLNIGNNQIPGGNLTSSLTLTGYSIPVIVQPGPLVGPAPILNGSFPCRLSTGFQSFGTVCLP